jgi:aminopeptidase N
MFRFLGQSIVFGMLFGLVSTACYAQQGRGMGIPGDPSEHEATLKTALWATKALQNAEFDPVLDVKTGDFDFFIDIEQKKITATATLTFEVKQAVASVYLFLSHPLELIQVFMSDGSNVPYDRTLDHRLIFSPAGGFTKGRHTLTIRYAGTPPRTQFGSFTFEDHASGPTVWTLSEPFGASDWHPSTNNPADKIDTVKIRVDVPSALKAVSNGNLIQVEESKGRTKYTWLSSYPISPYLISLAIGNYDEFTLWYKALERDSLPIVNYVYKGQNLTNLKSQAAQTLGMMSLFEELFGPYPFSKEKYGHAQFGFGGGMEHQTISSMYNLSYFLVAHELAHQWFGDKVTNARWNDLWIQEGFATYSEGLTVERFNTPEDFKNWLTLRRTQIVAQSDGSVYVPNEAIENRNLSRMFNARLTYRKAAWVLHMLRKKMGDALFFQAARKYLKEERAYGAASTEDFRKVMESVYGASLEPFFQQWVYGEGHPNLTVNYRIKNASTGYTSLEIKQKSSHSSVPKFEFPLQVRFATETRDTLITLLVKEPSQSFEVQPGFAWKTLQMDPNVQLLYGSILLTSLEQEAIPDLPAGFSLAQAYPNPFNPEVSIPIRLARTGRLQLQIVDVGGRIVAQLEDGVLQGGNYTYRWNATGWASGVYLIKARMGGQVQVQLISLIK